MPAAVLPRVLEEKFDEFAHQIRRLRLYRGASWVALLVLLTAVGAMALDASLDLPGYARGLLLCAWLVIGFVALWRLVLQPMRAPIPLADLAAAVEERYPSLAERLYSVVELSEEAVPGNGSEALIAVLTRETAQRSKRLNFHRAAPTRAVLKLIGITVVAGLLATVLLFASGATEYARRFLLPWYVPRVEAPYKVVASSGDLIAKRGEPVTLTGYLERILPEATFPDSASLVYRDTEASSEKKLPMTGDENAAFHVTRPSVASDFEYCVEAGTIRSAWHTVTVVDPVDFAEGTEVIVTPPAYAAPTFTEQRAPGIREFDGLQFSRVRLAMQFDRAAVSGAMEWKPSDPNGLFPPERLPVILSADKRSGSIEFTLKSDGTLKLILIGDRNVRTEATIATRAIVDTPPRFVRVTGITDQVQDIRPDDHLKLDLAVEDDVKIEEVVLEYKLNDVELPVHAIPLPLKEIGTPRAEGVYTFSLAGKVQAGDTVQYRVKARDGRRLAEFNLKPQEVTYPEKEWAQLRVRESARPLMEQEIIAQHDRLQERLKNASRDTIQALNTLDEVRRKGAGRPALGIENTVKLEEARNKARDVARDLDDIAREAGLTPDLRPFAERIRNIAETALRQADEAMRKAGNEAATPPRDLALNEGVDKLEDAQKRIDQLLDQNEALARDRLDRKRLEALAAEQKRLAEEAAQKANDPKALQEIAKEQERLNAELQDLIRDNPTLQQAVKDLARDQARDLAEEAARLAADQKALDQAAQEAHQKAQQQAFADLLRQQQELAQKQQELARNTQDPARLANAKPLQPEQFDKPGEHLEKNQAIKAMTEQEKAARELDRLARELERDIQQRQDPKIAARQLARVEDELRKKAKDALKDQRFDQLDQAMQDRMRAEQEALRQATERLSVPADKTEAQQARQAAAQALERARDTLQGDGANAEQAMQKAAEALQKLSDALPSRDERLKQSRVALEQLQREQDELSKSIEQTTKSLERQAPDAATQKQLAEKLQRQRDQQKDLAKRLAELDTPGHEARKDRAHTATLQASEDLERGLPQDIPASQAEARRQIEYLKQALQGKKPVDEAVDELAKKQKQLAEQADRLTGRPQAQEHRQMQELQREIQQGLESLKDPTAAERLQRAREATKASENALRTPNEIDELKKKSRAAAQELEQLARNLGAQESDQERVERLAREQRERSDRSRDQAQQPTTPEATAEEIAGLERELDDLRRSRAGDAQEAKKKATEALQRLRQQPTPERSPGMQKAAAEALEQLAEAMKTGGDRTAKLPTADNPEDPMDSAEGLLPSKDDVQQARNLADQQRQLRDQVAQARDGANKPPMPTDRDKFEQLAQDQRDLAQEAARAGEKAPGEAQKAGQAAAEAAQQAAEQLQAGNPDQAQAKGGEAKAKLEEMAQAAAGTPAEAKARELADKQQQLNQKLAEAAKDPGAAEAQRRARQVELAQQAQKLADKLEQAKENPGNAQGEVNPQALEQAAQAAKAAQQAMNEARQAQEQGRQGEANNARQKAEQQLQQSAQKAAQASGEDPDSPRGNPNARQAGEAAQQANQQQQQGQKQAQAGDGQGAQQAMQNAAKALDQAAQKLAQATGGQPGTGEPQGNDGSAQGETTKVPIPDDLTPYLGKPWGELPGDVKTKIIQDLQARYGEDYARVIKLYFESIAERK